MIRFQPVLRSMEDTFLVYIGIVMPRIGEPRFTVDPTVETTNQRPTVYGGSDRWDSLQHNALVRYPEDSYI